MEGLKPLFHLLQARGLHVDVEARIRLQAILREAPDLDADALCDVLVALLARSAHDRHVVREAFHRWHDEMRRLRDRSEPLPEFKGDLLTLQG